MPEPAIRKRGNPNWGKPASFAWHATEFEMQIMKLHLTPENYIRSSELRSWCEENKNRCYIPEWLLKAWNITVNADLSGAA